MTQLPWDPLSPLLGKPPYRKPQSPSPCKVTGALEGRALDEAALALVVDDEAALALVVEAALALVVEANAALVLVVNEALARSFFAAFSSLSPPPSPWSRKSRPPMSSELPSSWSQKPSAMAFKRLLRSG